jgi:hypothetical protein
LFITNGLISRLSGMSSLFLPVSSILFLPYPLRPSRQAERTGWGLHASHLGPTFYGVDSTIARYRQTYSLGAIGFLL